MIVMPANSTGWFFHCLARETGKLGHLYSPGAERGPWPWFPYALDNGVFSLWTPEDNSFDETRWLTHQEANWRRLIFWAQAAPIQPIWAIVPDRPGDAAETFRKWSQYASIVAESGFPLALAVQDGMTAETVRAINPAPDVIAVGGSTEWKWATVEMWAKEFPRVLSHDRHPTPPALRPTAQRQGHRCRQGKDAADHAQLIERGALRTGNEGNREIRVIEVAT